MTVQDIVTMVSTVGFPIVCCIAIYRSMMQFIDSFNTKLTDIMRQHADEVKVMQKSLDDNTAVIQRLLDKIGSEEE